MKLGERMPRVGKAVNNEKGGYFEESQVYFDLFNTYLVTTWFHMCCFIVLIYSLLFYNVENSKNKENILEWVGVSKLLTGTVCQSIFHYLIVCSPYSLLPWIQLDGDVLYLSQAADIGAYHLRPDTGKLQRSPMALFSGHLEDVCRFAVTDTHLVSGGR